MQAAAECQIRGAGSDIQEALSDPHDQNQNRTDLLPGFKKKGKINFKKISF